MEELLEDNRFAHIAKDPRFRQMKKQDRKVKIDKRFDGMFKDKSFKLKYSVDKRGRPLHATSNENLKKFYEMSSSDDSSNEEVVEKKNKNKVSTRTKIKNKDKEIKSLPTKCESDKDIDCHKEQNQLRVQGEKQSSKKTSADCSQKVDGRKSKQKAETSVVRKWDKVKGVNKETDGTSHSDDTDGEEGAVSDVAKTGSDSEEEDENTGEEEDSSSEQDMAFGDGPDLARGGGDVESSDDDDLDSEFEDDKLDHKWGELDKDAEAIDKITKRLAVCNMDWDRIKAQDLLMLFNSFKPTDGVIYSVKIYPSEFGFARMQEEEVKGPSELTQASLINADPAEDNPEGSQLLRERMRQYQLNRLKYYYAVVECDSSATADCIYNECDGMEYESSATKIDLRFIPDVTTFENEPKSVAMEPASAGTYKPTLFINSALQQSQVQLTWDEMDRDRVAVTMREFNKEDLEELDVKDYLASSSGEDEPGGVVEQPVAGDSDEDEDTKIQAYKSLIQGIQDSEQQKEEKDTEMQVTWEPGLKEAATDLVKKSKEGDLTPWEKYLEKKKEKKKKKKTVKNDKSEQSVKNVDGEEAALSDDDLPGGVDLSDPYFAEEMEDQDRSSSGGAAHGKKDKKKKKHKTAKKVLTAEEEQAKKLREAELELLLMDEEDQRQHFSLKAIMQKEKDGKKKKKMKRKDKSGVPEVEDTFKINVDDSRFQDIYQNPLFNMDPTAPEFKKTRAMENLIGEKLKRRNTKPQSVQQEDMDDMKPVKLAKLDSDTKPQRDASLASLVKSVKAKTKLLQSIKAMK